MMSFQIKTLHQKSTKQEYKWVDSRVVIERLRERNSNVAGKLLAQVDNVVAIDTRWQIAHEYWESTVECARVEGYLCELTLD